MRVLSFNFLIESISPFRLIEHQIHPIVNGVDRFSS